MAMQDGDSLFTFLGQLQIFHRLRYERLDNVPEKTWISIGQIGGILVAQLGRRAGFIEFMVKIGEFLQVARISQLSNQVRRPNQPGFGFCILMVAGFRNREPGQFNRPNYAFSVDFGGLGQALADEILASLYMIGRQTGIGCAARRGKPVSSLVNDERCVGIAGTGPANVANIVA